MLAMQFHVEIDIDTIKHWAIDLVEKHPITSDSVQTGGICEAFRATTKNIIQNKMKYHHSPESCPHYSDVISGMGLSGT